VKVKMGKTIKILLSVFIVLGFVLIANHAGAYFKVAQNQTPALSPLKTKASYDAGPEVLVPAKSVFDEKRIVQVGSTPIIEDIVSKGTDLPLKVALEMLLPSRAWTIQETVSDPDIMNQELTWDHRGTWLEGLDEIGQMQPLNFLVNWTTRTLYVSDAKDRQVDQPTRKAEPAFHVKKKPDQIKTNAAAHESLPLVVKELKPQETFPSGNLEENLSKYVKRHNYDFAWDLDPGFVYSTRYPIMLPADRSFLQNLKLIENSLNQQGFNFQFEAYTNAVVRVTEKK
jgi:hypothetical protein